MRHLQLRSLVLAGALCVVSAPATAVPITAAQFAGVQAGLETGMEAIFAGTNITNIVFQALVTVADPASFLDVDTLADQNGLLTGNALGETAAFPVVTAYIVDTISYCGGVNILFIGCALGNVMYLEGSQLLLGIGDELFAHELGHNLGLSHLAVAGNLMNPTIGENNDALTAGQITDINASGLIQAGTLTIKPVLLVAATVVDEPGTLALIAIAVWFAGTRRRRVA